MDATSAARTVSDGNFAVLSLWLPAQYETQVRATAFAFATSVGCFIGAIVNFALAHHPVRGRDTG